MVIPDAQNEKMPLHIYAGAQILVGKAKIARILRRLPSQYPFSVIVLSWFFLY